MAYVEGLPAEGNGIVRVSFQVLENVLRLPNGISIERVFINPSEVPGAVSIVLRGAGLPPVSLGSVIPVFDLVYRAERHFAELKL